MEARKLASPFDYTVQVTRKNRYLVVSSKEFGLHIAAEVLPLDQASLEGIGKAIVSVYEQVRVQMDQLRRQGQPLPRPFRSRRAGRSRQAMSD